MKKIFNQILALLFELVDTKVDMIRLRVLEFVSATIAITMTIMIAVLVIGMGLIFSSVGLALYLNDLTESHFWGFIILGGGFVLIGLILALVVKTKKKPLLINYIIKNLSGLIYEEKDKESK